MKSTALVLLVCSLTFMYVDNSFYQEKYAPDDGSLSLDYLWSQSVSITILPPLRYMELAYKKGTSWKSSFFCLVYEIGDKKSSDTKLIFVSLRSFLMLIVPLSYLICFIFHFIGSIGRVRY